MQQTYHLHQRHRPGCSHPSQSQPLACIAGYHSDCPAGTVKTSNKEDLMIYVASIDTGQYSHHHAWLHNTCTHCRDASIVNF